MHDDNRYRWYDPNTNTYGYKLTFKELMYTFYEKIQGRSQYNWRTKKYEYEWKWNDHYRIECEFSCIGHTDNDIYWVEPEPAGYWETEWKWVPEDPTKYVYGEDGETIYQKMILRPFKKYVRYPEIKKFRNRIVDSWGRTISAGFLKAEYKKYIPNEADKPNIKLKYRLSKWGRRDAMMRYEDGSLKGYKYRQGPVPGLRKHRKWRYPKNNHGSTTGELRQWYGDQVDMRETLDEFGITYKIKGSRNRYTLCSWNWRDRHFIGKRGNGWKRTRKEKQWM